MGRKTGRKEKEERTILSYKKRLRDTGENPKKKQSWCAAGCGRTENGKFCRQKEEQKKEIVVHRVHAAPRRRVLLLTFVGENCKTHCRSE